MNLKFLASGSRRPYPHSPQLFMGRWRKPKVRESRALRHSEVGAGPAPSLRAHRIPALALAERARVLCSRFSEQDPLILLLSRMLFSLKRLAAAWAKRDQESCFAARGTRARPQRGRVWLGRARPAHRTLCLSPTGWNLGTDDINIIVNVLI